MITLLSTILGFASSMTPGLIGVWRQHKDSSTVAKATGMDVLRTILEEMERTILQGTPFKKFQKTITPA